MPNNLDNPPAPLASIVQNTRAGNAASGNVAYTGVGFKPSAIIFVGYTAAGGGSIGHSGTNGKALIRTDGGAVSFTQDAMIFSDGAGGYQEAAVLSFDSDGFTLTWTKTLTGSGNITFDAICMR